MRADIPKQYLKIHHQSILEHAINCLLTHNDIAGVVVAVAENDTMWQNLSFSTHKPVITTMGGRERYHSVKNALDRLSSIANENDWVLVHDAARPCLRHQDIDQLIKVLREHPVGGLLACPVRDTMKRSDENETVIQTVDRATLWHALTPQMFRIKQLRHALQAAIDHQVQVTDEAAAMERLGLQPKLVRGHADNIKVTTPEDLQLAAFYLTRLIDT
ncbi:MAG: 2-C-methyl-D-erythritol 4-phosphate cytidylyltransferase [Gammaproteobacteria bacterium]|nr:2-C-methyl-D-erythritol 4-phosphate cytidylyltransferase [Gammaproteobacteria bacterium]